ncbi:MAG: hypothetical protein KF752_13025 [Pirellulaceae bacterium]|nr:hypothetical protein [Pirellulaceae bacterium]
MMNLRSLNFLNDNHRQSAPTFGLDIGTHAVKLVAAQLSAGQCNVTNCGRLELPPHASKDAVRLGTLIANWLDDMAISADAQFACSLPSTLVDYASVPLANSPSEPEVSDLAYQMLGDLLGDKLPEMTHDYWHGDASTSTDLHLVWTSASFAKELVQRIAQHGPKCRQLDAPATALARLGQWTQEHTLSTKRRGRQQTSAASPTHVEACLVVDLSGDQASFVWSRNGQAVYVRNRIRFSDQTAIDTLSARLSISPSAAETLLSTWGVSDDQTQPLACANSRWLSDWLDGLEFELRRTTGFLHNRHGTTAVGRLVLCGGGACISGLAPWLSARLELPVALAEPAVGYRWRAAHPYRACYAQALSLVQLQLPQPSLPARAIEVSLPTTAGQYANTGA